jgi:hypothetical protein
VNSHRGQEPTPQANQFAPTMTPQAKRENINAAWLDALNVSYYIPFLWCKLAR